MGLHQARPLPKVELTASKEEKNKGNTKKETEVSLSLTNFVLLLCIIT